MGSVKEQERQVERPVGKPLEFKLRAQITKVSDAQVGDYNGPAYRVTGTISSGEVVYQKDYPYGGVRRVIQPFQRLRATGARTDATIVAWVSDVADKMPVPGLKETAKHIRKLAGFKK